MRVFIASRGEMHEGSSIIGVYTTQESAIKAALKSECCFEGGWKQSSGGFLMWENGCDYVKVAEYYVNER